NNLFYTKAEPITLGFASTGLTSVAPSGLAVRPAPAVKVIVTRPPGGIIAGKSFSLTAEARDPYNNLDTSFAAPVTVGLGGGSSGTLTGTLTVPAQSGVANFNDLVDTTSGPISLDVSSGNLTKATAGGLTISPSTPDHLVIHSPASPTATAG